jgi:hypothetical protein
MKRFQFSLAALIGVVIYFAAFFAVVRSGPDYDSMTISLVNSAVLVTYLAGGSAVACSRSNHAFWCGFYTWGLASLYFMWFEYTAIDLLVPPETPGAYAPITSIGVAFIGGCFTRYLYRRIRGNGTETSATDTTIQPPSSK